MQKQYEKLMKKCLSLAKKGMGQVSPNPMVGCIIFDDDFNIISKGYHKKYGGNHAERNAILSTNTDLKGKSLIVNLEPCSHYGKTPPCADLIIEKGIKRVIIGMQDPNPIVSGNGIKKLKNAGIEVISGILEKECLELNEIFVKNQTKKLPFITIKTAVTLDGKIASNSHKQEWITDEFSRREVHKLRNQYDAILTSSATVINDNPKLTCRIKNGRNPVRIVLDTNLSTPADSNVYNNDGTKVYIIVSENVQDEQINKYPSHIEIIKCPILNNHIDLRKTMEILYNKGISSIIAETGGMLNKALIEAKLPDKLIQFIAPKILGDDTGVNFVRGFDRNSISKCNNLKVVSTKLIKNDIIIIGSFMF